MSNLKTKLDKRGNDNEKRRRSIKEREKAKLNQAQIVKQALSSSNLSNGCSKKIVFDDDDGDDDDKPYKLAKGGVSNLFDGSSSEDENFEIKEKVQFGGKKGFELLNLQSTYGNDERFKIDERFLEDEDNDIEAQDKANCENTDTREEKVKELKILESVLGQPVTKPDSEKKAKKRTYEMVRYNASNKEHEIYEIKQESETVVPAKKRKERKRTQNADAEQQPKPLVSKEKFYEVSHAIKSSFKKEKEETGQFSILQTYGENDNYRNQNKDVEKEEEEEEEEEEAEEEEIIDIDEHNISNENKNHFKTKVKNSVQSSFQEQIEEKPKTESKAVVAKGIWKESFFFVPDDPRFKEGLEFMNKKGSEEAQQAAEDYDQTRKKLKEILRLHMKKQLHKMNPFKNKVGGLNKKQLANSRLKNSRTIYSKRKPFKV